MTEINCIIVEDESSARDILENLLINFCEGVNVMDKCHDLESGVAAIKKLKPNVVFLDIEMPNYAGYEIVNFFDQVDFEIVFVTAYDKYALKAFEVSALDYLLKPVDIDRLEETIQKVKNKLELETSLEQFKILQNSIQTKKINKLPVMHQGYRQFVDLSEIVAFEAQESYCKIYMTSGDTFLVSKKVKYYEDLLEEERGFFRSHKSWMVNMDHMKSYSKSNQEIMMVADVTAKLSRYRIAEFEAILEVN